MAFIVSKIIDADTIEVSPRWEWEQYAGDQIKIKGFNIFKTYSTQFIIDKLTSLLLSKDVELKNPSNPQQNNGNDQITANVFLSGTDISVYFPELKIVA